MAGKKERPRIEIEASTVDRFIEAFGFMMIILLIGIPSFFYSELPEIIPRHYGLDGTPDGYSGKIVIWILPSLGLLMYVGLYFLSRNPHRLNYAVKISEENAERQYKIAVKMIRVLNALIATDFCYKMYASVQISFGNQSGLGWSSFIIFLILIFGTIIFYTSKSIRAK